MPRTRRHLEQTITITSPDHCLTVAFDPEPSPTPCQRCHNSHHAVPEVPHQHARGVVRVAAVSGSARGAAASRRVDGARGDRLQLVELMPAFRSVELGIYAIYPTRKHVAPKVRALIDFLTAQFSPTHTHW